MWLKRSTCAPSRPAPTRSSTAGVLGAGCGVRGVCGWCIWVPQRAVGGGAVVASPRANCCRALSTPPRRLRKDFAPYWNLKQSNAAPPPPTPACARSRNGACWASGWVRPWRRWPRPSSRCPWRCGWGVQLCCRIRPAVTCVVWSASGRGACGGKGLRSSAFSAGVCARDLKRCSWGCTEQPA